MKNQDKAPLTPAEVDAENPSIEELEAAAQIFDKAAITHLRSGTPISKRHIAAMQSMSVALSHQQFDLYQMQAHNTAIYPESFKKIDPNMSKLTTDMLSLCYAGLGLGEAGEAQNKIKKILRDSNGVITQDTKDHLIKELGGILWYVSEIATLLNVQLSEVAYINLAQLQSRAERGKLHGSGDDR